VKRPFVVVYRQLVESLMDIIADTTGDLSWAYSQEFEAKLDEALRDIEGGSLESVETIDQLIEYIDVQRQSAQEES
jgi:hypothetical protein